MTRRTINLFASAIITATLFCGCKKNDEAPETASHYLIFKFKFDSTQPRLDGFGNPSAVPANHSAQSPRFNKMSAHYIELAPFANTQLGKGMIVYKAPETDIGGDVAIDFDQATLAGEGETFYSIPIKNVTPGSYEYLRVSLAYQNYDINFRVNVLGNDTDLTGTLASFIGYNTFITDLMVKNNSVAINQNKKQGYWAFEASAFGFDTIYQGQAPAGATTVPNPIDNTSPIPAGSCVVTGAFPSTFLITGDETQDIVITVSLSTNKSFEWVEHSAPNYYEPANGDTVVDMGIRGLVPIVN